ncbi:MAG TPA: sugar ABC transporter substrate-binding protein [Bacilli bacterium]
MKQIRLVLLLLLTLCFIAVGCSSNSVNEPTETTETTEPTKETPKEKVTVSMAYWGSDFDKSRMEKIKAEFDKEHPNIDVKLILLPNSNGAYDQKMLATMAAGEPYDVVQLAESFYSFAAKGTLEDLTPYLAKDNVNIDDYYKSSVDAYSYKGKVMGMPMRTGSMIMLYNKTLFDKHSLKYPDENFTWDDFVNAAVKITDIPNGVFGVDWIGSWWPSYQAFVYPQGGSMLNEDRTEFTLDSPEAVKGLQLMQDLIWKHHVSPQPNEWPKGVDLWTSGKMGMKVDGPWHILSSQSNIKDFEWDIAPIPRGTVAATPMFSNAFSITKLSKNKDAAWEVAKFWTGKTGQEILASEHGEVPPLKSVANSPIYLDLGGKAPKSFNKLLIAAESAFTPQATIKWDEINNVIGAGVDAILNTNTPIDSVMPKMKEDVTKLLEEAKQLGQ